MPKEPTVPKVPAQSLEPRAQSLYPCGTRQFQDRQRQHFGRVDEIVDAAVLVRVMGLLEFARARGDAVRYAGDPRHVFVRGDIGDRTEVLALLARHKPRAVLNFATSHAVRSRNFAGFERNFRWRSCSAR